MYQLGIMSITNIIRKYLLIMTLALFSFEIGAKAKPDSVIFDSYSVEIIDSLFFEQVDSFLNSRLSNIHLYRYFKIDFLVYIDPLVIKSRGYAPVESNLYYIDDPKTESNYIPNRNDSVMYINIQEASSNIDPRQYYKLRFKGINYLVTKEAVGIFIKRKKKIYVKGPTFSILTMRDLMGHFWYLKWANNHISPIAIEERY